MATTLLAPSLTFTPSNNMRNVQAKVSLTSLEDSSAIPESKLELKSHRIWLSNIVVRKPKEKTKWHVNGIGRLIVVGMIHGLAMFAPFNFNWSALWVALVLYVLTGLFGVTLSFHRNLTHRSFKLVKWLEYLFAYFGSLALQGDPIGWVRTHRYHHKFTDTKRDPHSPLEGFWYSHIGWIFDSAALADKRGGSCIVQDLKRQKFYKFMRSTYLLHHFALGFFLYALGGFPYLVWGMGVRTTTGYHVTFLVNSVCHVWGNQAWNTGDLSKNNWWVALLTAGEGWHNNHHAFEYSARHGLEWWQVDLTWHTIKLLEGLGLASDVKLPTMAHKQRMAFKL
ncbi:palmitoyl-monogalactosyldiacylglycerol delta-7 desaturase, chloroplastic-like [Silene latifolia]|uniref:palmitoyl-monogalactosyldiacylglycerol delta-7 desaturase, chloroplastic-like n=1 Tax=Silene latifolia TaxID=37657 RepID=UPI003D776054